MKVGADLQDDIRRCKLVREMIGPENILVYLYTQINIRFILIEMSVVDYCLFSEPKKIIYVLLAMAFLNWK